MDKALLREAIVKALEAQLALLVQAAHAAKDEATDAESRQEGKYDMRAQSAAYLAAGQAQLASELGEAIGAYRALPVGPLPAGSAAAVGALVTLTTKGSAAHYFLGPARGGIAVEVGGETVTLITPGSPLGRQLLGRRVGDVVTRPGHKSGETIGSVE